MNKGANRYHLQKNPGYRNCFKEIEKHKYVPNEKICKLATRTLRKDLTKEQVMDMNVNILKEAFADYYVKRERWKYLDNVINCLRKDEVYATISKEAYAQLDQDRERALQEWRESPEGKEFYKNHKKYYQYQKRNED